jgi:hypothetical protein
MSTPKGIEAAIPYLSARELAELQKILREREKRRARPVKIRVPKEKLNGTRVHSRKSTAVA